MLRSIFCISELHEDYFSLIFAQLRLARSALLRRFESRFSWRCSKALMSAFNSSYDCVTVSARSSHLRREEETIHLHRWISLQSYRIVLCTRQSLHLLSAARAVLSKPKCCRTLNPLRHMSFSFMISSRLFSAGDCSFGGDSCSNAPWREIYFSSIFVAIAFDFTWMYVSM